MNCEEARMLIDAFIDGELSEEEKRALMDHAQACEMCAQELEAAELLRDTLAHIDDEVQVPLQAQAAWRSAVRAESKKKNTRKWMRAAYAAAAALVLVIGGSFAFREMPVEQSQVMMMKAGAPVAASELIARDGVSRQIASSPDTVGEYSVWKKISSENPVQDRQAFEMLAAEYNGSCTLAGDDICSIELPMEYLDDFMHASSRIGSEQFCEIVEDNDDKAVIIIQFCEE